MRGLLLFALIVVLFTAIVVPSASAKSERLALAKSQYYHAVGYIKAIGKNAHRTIYSSNPRIRHKWQGNLAYLVRVRHRAYLTLHPAPRVSSWLADAFACIHRYEGAWNANTGNGYYGGLQMDLGFQGRYGALYYKQWGTADHWPVWAQIDAATVAYYSGRGFGPWPNTARFCGLL